VNLARLVELIPVLGLPESAGRHYGRTRAALTAAGTAMPAQLCDHGNGLSRPFQAISVAGRMSAEM